MIYRFDDCVLDTERRELRRGGVLRPLEPQVFDLLEFLLRHRERVVSKDDILAAVWRGRAVSDAALSTRINAARSAIGDDGAAQRLICTLRGKGFRFVATLHAERAIRSRPAPPTAPPTSLDKPAVAILPFANLAGHPEYDALVDGLTEALVVALSRLPSVAAINCGAAARYGHATSDARELARDLGARYIVHGTMRESDGGLRFTVELADAATARNLWADHFDRRSGNVFALQDDIAQAIAAAVSSWMQAAEQIRIARKRSDRLDTTSADPGTPWRTSILRTISARRTSSRRAMSA